MSEMTPKELAEACAKQLWESDSASAKLGMKIERVAPDEAVLTMTVSDAMTNGHGITHGGYIFTLADSAFAFACNSQNQSTVAQHCTITFIKPGALGDRLTACARQVSQQGRSGIYDVTVSREDGTVIAEFRGHSRSLGKPVLPDNKIGKTDEGSDTSEGQP